MQEAQANYDATVANYRATVLTAIQQVEDDLSACASSRPRRSRRTARSSRPSSLSTSRPTSTSRASSIISPSSPRRPPHSTTRCRRSTSAPGA
ncbi:MAG: hypothetical protein WDO13_19760 [Verrucomicrobiota bacterium]